MTEYAKKLDKISSTSQPKTNNLKNSKAFIEELKLQWMSTLDAISDPIAIIDKNYIIRKSNKAMAKFTSHKNVKKIIGQKCYKVFAGLDQPCQGCPAMDVLHDGHNRDFTFNRPSDQKIYEISSFPVTDPATKKQKEHDGVVQIYRDRTFHHKMQEKIRQHDKLTSLGILTSGIAHEINNPLSGILLFSQMLLKEIPSHNEHYSDLVEIEAAAQRCKEIVNQILEFSRQSPHNVKKKSEVSLRDILQTAMRFARVLKVSKDSRVIYDWQDGEVMVLGCRNRLIQVFLNLFKNAFQAMPDGGELYITQWKERVDGRSMVVVEIKDTGIGIQKEQLSQVFDPFFTTKSPKEGTGLGLAICFGILQELEGQITAQSTPHKGAVFKVSLPSVVKFRGLREVIPPKN
ncbi:MAG: ATP-binding protein [Proteobacteria bacterium]|nr:ATP-binding protein [Pseudomonadota bacterium]